MSFLYNLYTTVLCHCTFRSYFPGFVQGTSIPTHLCQTQGMFYCSCPPLPSFHPLSHPSPLSLSLCLHPSSLSPQSTTGLTPITTTVNSSTWFSVRSNHLPSKHSSLSSLCTSLRSTLPPPFHLPLLAQSSTKFPHDADTDEPIDLELPNKWLWDIVDEFIYQVSFS